MRTILKTVLTAGILLSLGIASAQEAKTLPRHPGDVIKYEIKFDGPNADKMKSLLASMGLTTSVPKDQSGFASSFGTTGWISPSSPATFKVEMTVPPDIATGDYSLSLTARADEGRANYANGQDFTVPPIHIENPKKFTPPGVKVTPLP
jgi:hypothetical protein